MASLQSARTMNLIQEGETRIEAGTLDFLWLSFLNVPSKRKRFAPNFCSWLLYGEGNLQCFCRCVISWPLNQPCTDKKHDSKEKKP